MVSTEYLLLIFNHLLICFDLADVSMSTPSFLEGEMRDDDAMMVDDYGE